MKQQFKKIISNNLKFAFLFSKLYALILGSIAWWLRKFCFPFVHISSDVKFIGMRSIQIGKNAAIGSGCWLNVNNHRPRDYSLVIGENCFIGQNNLITSGKKITFRDYCLTAKACAFISSTHIYDDPLKPYISTGTAFDDEIYIGANCFFGIGVTVLGNVRIGHGCVIGAGAYIRQDIPPFSLVVGNPAKIIKRFDFKKNEWVKWPVKNYVEGPSEDKYINLLRSKLRWVIHPISAAQRGFYNTP